MTDGLHRLEPGEAGEALTLQRAAYVVEAQAHDEPRLPPLTETLEELRADLSDPEVVALGLRERGRLLGTVRLKPVPGAPHARELARLAVAPDRQREGLGTRLLLGAEARRPPGVAELRLFTGEHSASNLRLYARHGYAETHRQSVGSHEIVFMVKRLDGGAG